MEGRIISTVIDQIIDSGTQFIIILERFLFYSQDTPLIFTQWTFWAFFGILLLGYRLVEKHIYLRTVYLTLFSLFFYYKTSGAYFCLLILVTLVVYGFSILMDKIERKSVRKCLLAFSVLSSLSILFYLKYARFILDTLTSFFGTEYDVLNVAALLENEITGVNTFIVGDLLLPVGISFYTFQLISYAVDIYRKEVRVMYNFWDLMFYISFFPQLVAGPIVRAKEFFPQIRKPYNVTNQELWRAVLLIVLGMAKKTLFSDVMTTNYIDKIFSNPFQYSGIEILFAIYGYAIQIYFDFSGYSDIAIGLALILGFRLPQNFNTPYLATNISAFWRQWHISLSAWLKDYLYIPLGGNRKGTVKQYRNILITMTLGGLWHGASWKFLAWGVYHGVWLIIHKLLLELKWFRKLPIPRFLSILLTFHLVCLSWVFFRAETMTDVFFMLESIISSPPSLLEIFRFAVTYQEYTALFLLSLFFVFVLSSYKDRIQRVFIGFPIVLKLILLYWVTILLLFAQNTSSIPFIYFQF